MENPNLNKSVQIINFFAQKEQGRKIEYLKLLKLVYLADKFMLRHYGRMLSNDQYYALPHGPIPSLIKDIANGIVYDRTSETEDPNFPVSQEYCLDYLRHSPWQSETDKRKIESVKDFDRDLFSSAEIKSMEAVWNEFGGYDKWRLRDITHDFNEWKKYNIDGEKRRSARIDTVDLFLDSQIPAIDTFFNPDPKDVEIKKSFYIQSQTPEVAM